MASVRIGRARRSPTSPRASNAAQRTMSFSSWQRGNSRSVRTTSDPAAMRMADSRTCGFSFSMSFAGRPSRPPEFSWTVLRRRPLAGRLGLGAPAGGAAPRTWRHLPAPPWQSLPKRQFPDRPPRQPQSRGRSDNRRPEPGRSRPPPSSGDRRSTAIGRRIRRCAGLSAAGPPSHSRERQEQPNTAPELALHVNREPIPKRRRRRTLLRRVQRPPCATRLPAPPRKCRWRPIRR